MEAAEVVPGQPARVLASDREVTRLGESVFRTGAVSEEAMKATCAVLARMAALYRKLDVVGVRGGGHQRHPRHAQPARVSGARVGSGRHAGGNHFRPRRGAPDSPGRGEHLAAARQAHPDHRYRRRQRGDHRRRTTATCARPTPNRSAPSACARSSSRTIRPSRASCTRCTSTSRTSWTRAVRRLGHTGWDRVIATSATASAVAGAVARTAALQARRDRPPAHLHRAGAQALPRSSPG